ncbi:MAG: SusC/RagA family TonB-linked outer membrane protein [Chitinophagaceae bacterium]
MKLTSLILLVAGFTASASGYSQRVTLSVQDAPLETVFREIKKQTGYEFLYGSKVLQVAKPVSVHVKDMTLEQVLSKCFAEQPLVYNIMEKTVVIGPRPPTAPAAEEEKAPLPVTITGVVTDTSGSPLHGANVTVKGTATTVVTDRTGHFSIQANAGDMLVISYVGYERKEVKVPADATALTISLRRTNVALNEVTMVYTGYQTLSQRELASAVTQVKMKDIELGSKYSVDQMLAGVIPGLMALQNSGEPGATPKIRIRGTTSIVGGSAPLWVLDGIILEDPVNVDLSNLTSPDAQYLVGNSIAGINARDIESITVLKDASASAIYGSRAANGVIVVTTKKGRVGKPQVTYSGNLSINQRVSYGDLNLMNAGERVQLSQDILADNIQYSRAPRRLGYEGLYLDYLDRNISYDQFKSGVQKMIDNNTDWYDLLFRNSITNNQSVSLSGGNDRTTYYASLGYSNIQGAARGSDQTRYSGMIKINSWVHSKLFAGLQVNASNTKGNGFHSSVNPNKYAYETARTIPAYNDNGSYFMYLTQQKSQEFAAVSAPKEDMLYNILNETALTGANSNITNLTAQLNIEYLFLKGFRYKFLGGFDQSLTNSSSWAGEGSNYVATKRLWNAGVLVQGTTDFDNSVIPWGGIISNSDQRKTSYTLRNSLEYNRLLNRVHLINVMVSQEVRSLLYKGVLATYYGWQPERGNTISPAITTGYTGILNSLRPIITDKVNNNVSWLGTATYSYKDKLTFNGNIRADGSNNFGENPKYRFMPVWSVAGKYTLSNEPYLLHSKVISYLAIRGSYGLQGNIDKATSPDLIIRVGSRDGTTGLNESYFQYLANPDLRWEQTRSVNLGLEFALLPRRNAGMLDIISGTIDMYDKKGTAIIVTRQVSQVIGLDQVKVNGGKVNNKGVEGSIRIVPYQTKDVTVSVRLIASYNKNTLVEANREIGITNGNKIAGNALVEGKPIGAFYSYAFAGLNENSGYPMFYNNKGDKRYELYADETNLVYSGVNTPDLSGGFDLSMRYKNFYASFAFQYAVGGVARLPNFYRYNYFNVFDALANVSKELNDRWRAPGDEQYTTIPVLYDNVKYAAAKAALGIPAQLSTSEGPLKMYDQSDVRTAKTDNIRLRNINLSYVLQRNVLRKIGFENLTFNLQAENLFLIADKKWQKRDPESGGSNTPIPKVYTFGIVAGF